MFPHPTRIVSNGDNLHELSNPVFWKKIRKIKSIIELAQSVYEINSCVVLGNKENIKIHKLTQVGGASS